MFINIIKRFCIGRHTLSMVRLCTGIGTKPNAGKHLQIKYD